MADFELEGGRTSRFKLSVGMRRRKALELRLAGRMLWEIAEEIGSTESQVSRMLTKEVDKLEAEITESAERLRTIEAVRLEKIGEAIYGRAVDGELPAVDRYLKLQERRAKLLGLDLQHEKNEGGPTIVFTGFPWDDGGGGDVVDGEVVEIEPPPGFLPEPGDT